MKKAKGALKWLYEALLADIKSSSKLHMDETHLGQMFPGLGRLKTCRIWALCRDDRRWKGNKPPAVAFRYTQTREGVHAEEMLSGFDGVLQVDAYGGYNRLTSSTRIGGPLTLAYCWAHGLRAFLKDGRVEIDNNNLENTIRPLVQLRKASLFTGSADGGETWAIIASLVGTCRLNDIDPHAYITWVFEKFTQKVPRSQYDKLLPWHFAEEVEVNLRQ